MMEKKNKPHRYRDRKRRNIQGKDLQGASEELQGPDRAAGVEGEKQEGLRTEGGKWGGQGHSRPWENFSLWKFLAEK